MHRQPGSREVAATVLALGLLGGCAGAADDAPPAAGPSPSARSSDDGDPGDATTPTVPRLTSTGAALAPGTYRVGFLGGGAHTPDAVVEVPDGFDDGSAGGQRLPDGRGWYVVSHDGDAFLGLSVVGAVQRDACLRPRHDDVDPGHSVADLAETLTAQQSTRATTPERVSLAGHPGLYVQLTGPPDLGRCDATPELWHGRGIYGDGQVDQVWILDVDGQRLVIDASHTRGTTTEAELDELGAMVRSLQFVRAAAD